MSTTILDIVTPERTVYSRPVEMVILRGAEGDLGILPGHMPLVTTLPIGLVRIKEEGRWSLVALSGGFLEVRPDRVTVLAEAAELPEEIDVVRAERARERAERRLAEKGRPDIDYVRAELALKRALNRLRAAEEAKVSLR
ncbi:F0F1 ATP synthase subunit epsilon [Kyrpidia spormannii]|uniref:ATP synthase epsilon chain n=1 Tax=Kyrpidia spormannii TaxID=2055160 RepID=A0A2K8NA71_9BACL|nr:MULTISPECIES: F0F1 ATP synthase subunit epsilon [Kyrpidia]ATY86239.1 F0F1 ATP synthase subunit epsilon [Kyrpidia spormannii]MCL6576542.1 F0F1 ATP synthase subunit epsilon [Kyrpidia sp.]CAB3396262.1 ATP synthase (subunit epsilon, F1 subunit) [Kyrpidia spormannii]HHY67600.1 F0F1 ATP synthase subunit epsilon [Alicyclobacillus sp.]